MKILTLLFIISLSTFANNGSLPTEDLNTDQISNYTKRCRNLRIIADEALKFRLVDNEDDEYAQKRAFKAYEELADTLNCRTLERSLGINF